MFVLEKKKLMVPVAVATVLVPASVAWSVTEPPAVIVVLERVVVSVGLAGALASGIWTRRLSDDSVPPQPKVMELQAIELVTSHFRVIVTVSAGVTSPPWVLRMKKVYCPLPPVLVHERPTSVPEGIVTVKSRQTAVVVPTPARLTRKLSEPAAIFVKDLGESPVNVNVVAPITADVWAPVVPTPVSVMPPPVEEPVFVPDIPIGFAKAGVAPKSADIVRIPIIPNASFVAALLFVLFSPRRSLEP